MTASSTATSTPSYTPTSRGSPLSRFIPFLVTGTLVLVAGAFIFLPAIVEGFVARDLQDRLGLDTPPGVDLRAGPAEMLAGNFGGGRVTLPGYDPGGVRPEEVAIDLSPFDVDVLGSVAGGRLAYERAPSGTLRTTLSEAEVRRIAASEVVDFPVRGVELESGLALAHTEFYALGQSVPVAVEGGVSAWENALIFEPSNIEAAGVPVPNGLAAQLLGSLDFVYPITGLPPGIQITGAEVERDRLILTGPVELGL